MINFDDKNFYKVENKVEDKKKVYILKKYNEGRKNKDYVELGGIVYPIKIGVK
jgi:hypothetical protein